MFGRNGSGVEWSHRWTAEEARTRSASAIHDVTRLQTRERANTAASQMSGVSPEPSSASTVSSTRAAELRHESRIATLDVPVTRTLTTTRRGWLRLIRRVAADENFHFLFYRISPRLLEIAHPWSCCNRNYRSANRVPGT